MEFIEYLIFIYFYLFIFSVADQRRGDERLA